MGMKQVKSTCHTTSRAFFEASNSVASWWWFQYIFFFTPKLGEDDSHFDYIAYFSGGLKPSTWCSLIQFWVGETKKQFREAN